MTGERTITLDQRDRLDHIIGRIRVVELAVEGPAASTMMGKLLGPVFGMAADVADELEALAREMDGDPETEPAE
jgi:hypothetical protein